MKLQTYLNKKTRFNIPEIRHTDIMKTTQPLSKLQATIIYNRTGNVITDEVYSDLMTNKLDITKDLYLLKDVDIAGELIANHLSPDKHIVVVCDYDCDGITSGVVTYRMLTEKLGKTQNVSYIVNQRSTGNGYSPYLMSEIIKLHNIKPIDLIISSDHGSSNNDQFKVLKELGIKLVITDHHQIPENNYPTYPDVFVNNQRDDSDYSKDISGCFVVFLTMVSAYLSKNGKLVTDNVFDSIYPYVAISTVSDVMSMALPINRYIVKTGLAEINSMRQSNWNAIKSVISSTNVLTSRDIGFKLAPLINTASRLNCEKLAFEMLIENNPSVTAEKAMLLAEKNDQRKLITKKLTRHAAERLYESQYKNTVVSVIETDAEVNGIIAANLGTLKNKPTVCFIRSRENHDILKGSCRGIVNGVDVFNILRTIKEKHDTILQFGGHEGAAGCSISMHKLEEFSMLFDKYVTEQLNNLPSTHIINVDAVLPDSFLNPILCKSIESCGPYGNNWTEPIFLTKLKVLNVFITGSVARVIFLRKDGSEIEGVHFFSKHGEYTIENIKEFLPPYSDVLVAYNTYLNYYGGVYSTVLSIVDILKVGEDYG